MFRPPVDAIRSFESAPGASLEEQAEAFELTVQRGSIYVLITVPKSVLEWFVDAREDSTARSTTDWCDYTGYDDTPESELAVDMADDLKLFVRRILQRPLRFVDRRGILRKRFALEWECNGRWEQAIPMAEQTLAADAQKDARG